MTTVSSTSTTTTTSTTSSTKSSYASTDPSDIDWDGLIEEAVDAKLAKADSIETKLTAAETKRAAYEEAQSLLATLATAAEALRAPSGTLSADDDVFRNRTAYLTAVGDVTAASVVSVTADTDADVGTYELKVTQIAKAHRVSSADQTSSSEALALAGTITLGTAGTGSATIDVTADMDLAAIAEAVNAVTDDTGVKATVMKVSDTAYRLVLSSTETGQTIEATDGGGVLESLGVIDVDGAFADELQAAQNAVFSIDGVEMTRSTNDIDDALDGVTLHLYAVTSTDESSSNAVSLEIATDLSAVEDAVSAFVDAYNAYRDFALAQQTTSSDGTASTDAVLFGDSTLRSINTALASALTFSIDDTSLTTLGITFDDDNKLVLDTDTLESALLDDIDALEALFSYQFTASSSDLQLLRRGTEAPDSFTIDITVDADGTLTGASVGGDDSLFTVTGSRIVGATGTIYEGLVLVFTGTESASIDITTSRGLAERIYTAADGASDSSDGTLAGLIDNLSTKESDYQSQIDDIQTRAEAYRTIITARYARIQASISVAESTLSYLKALLAQSTDS